MIVCQCEFCGRVRINGEWAHRDDIQPSVVGTCATCMSWRHRAAQARYCREARGVARRAAKGYGPGTGDPFVGFREG